MSIQCLDSGSNNYVADVNDAMRNLSGANGFAVRLGIYVDGDADGSNLTVISDLTDNRIELRRLGGTNTWEWRFTTDGGSSTTTVGSAFTIPQGEWCDMVFRVVNGAQAVYMWRESTGTTTVASDTQAYIGTPDDNTSWRIGNTSSATSAFKMEEFAVWTTAPSAANLQSMLTNRESSDRNLSANLSWLLHFDQTSGTVTGGDPGLEDSSASNYDVSPTGTMTWVSETMGLDSDLLQNVTSVTVPSAGSSVTAVWETGETLGTVSDTDDWSGRFTMSLGDDGGYDLVTADPAGASSVGESGGDVTLTWDLNAIVRSGETLTYTFTEGGAWTDDSTPPYQNAAQTALTAGTTNSSTQSAGDCLTRFVVAPIAVSATYHNRPIASGTANVNVMVMDEWCGTQAVRFNWYESDGSTPKSVSFTPHGGSASSATSHTVTASAWVAPFAESSEEGEFWGGAIDVSGESDGAVIVWEWEVQDHYGTWHSACSDGTAWPQKSILVHTDPLIIHVSNSGNDTTGDGSSGNPYATLQASGLVTAVRGASKPVEIHHATGTYTIGAFDMRPGGTGSAHEHLITLRPAAGATVTYNNSGLVANATIRGNIEFRDLAFDMDETAYGWTVGTANVEDEERKCWVNCTLDDGADTKTSGADSIELDGDDCYIIGGTQSGRFRGLTLNEFDPGSGYRGVKDAIVWGWELTDSGTAMQMCFEGGLIGANYVHDNAQDSSYPGAQHFDCWHAYALNGATNRRMILYRNLVEDNGSVAEGFAYNQILCTCDNVDNGCAFNIRKDANSQPAYQIEAYTQNFQMSFNVDDGTVNMIRDDSVADSEVGRMVLIQNNLLGNLASFRDKLLGLPERVLGGNVVATTSGTYPTAAEDDGSLLVAATSGWGLADYDNGDYTVGAGTAVTARPTNWRYDYAGNPINRSAPVAAGAYSGTAVPSGGDATAGKRGIFDRFTHRFNIRYGVRSSA